MKPTVEHIFRHEYGPLVAALLRRVGVQHLDLVEDAVQFALMRALEFWSRDGEPEAPSAWLYTVAYRQLLSDFRRTQRQQNLLVEHTVFISPEPAEQGDIPLPSEMGDSLLKMLFVTCDEGIPVESQLVFTLKSLCGFSVREIALRLFISEANVYKRFSRAREYLKTQTIVLEGLTAADMAARLPMVHRVLYLLFTEGYLSSHSSVAIRRDLCEEAIRLALLMAESPLGDIPETYALLALMHFHLARIAGRQDDSGALLLLEQQDRRQWDKHAITVALNFLARSAQGDTLSRYHVEAGIAAEHCLAPTFAQTHWDKIVAAYELLERIAPSAFHVLNRAIALAEWKGPKAGLAVLQAAELPSWLTRSYHWSAVLADLQRRAGDMASARENAERAIKDAPTDDIKQLLRKRFKRDDV